MNITQKKLDNFFELKMAAIKSSCNDEEKVRQCRELISNLDGIDAFILVNGGMDLLIRHSIRAMVNHLDTDIDLLS